MNILHVDSSILGEHSVSRRVSSAIVARLRDLDAAASVTVRDLVASPLPSYTGAIAAARALPPNERPAGPRDDIAALDAALDEVLAADVIVIGAPMYNFGLPSQLKDWVDALAVAGRTFRYGATGAEGLLGGKRAIIASARGGLYGPDSAAHAFDHQETHLQSFLRFVGIVDIDVIRAEGVMMGPAVREQALHEALQASARLALA